MEKEVVISVNGSESRIVFIDHQHGDMKVRRTDRREEGREGGRREEREEREERRGRKVQTFFSAGKSAADLQPARHSGCDGRGPK